MLTLREEALQIVNEVPENLLAEFVQNLRDLKNKFAVKTEQKNSPTMDEIRNYLISNISEVDPKKASAFAEIEQWQEKNKDFLNSVTDWEQERWEAMNEKYGTFD